MAATVFILIYLPFVSGMYWSIKEYNFIFKIYETFTHLRFTEVNFWYVKTNLSSSDLATLLLYFVGYFTSSITPTSFPIGKSNVRIRCASYQFEMTLDIRQNKNEDFMSVMKCNESGIHRLNNETNFEGVIILYLSGRCSFDYYWFNYVDLIVFLQADKCTLGPQTSASTRCLFSNRTATFNSSEENIYSIEGIYRFNWLC